MSKLGPLFIYGLHRLCLAVTDRRYIYIYILVDDNGEVKAREGDGAADPVAPLVRCLP